LSQHTISFEKINQENNMEIDKECEEMLLNQDLESAIEHQNFEFIQNLLVHWNKNDEKKNNYFKLALFNNSNLKIIQILFDFFKPIDLQFLDDVENYEKETSIMYAAKNGNDKVNFFDFFFSITISVWLYRTPICGSEFWPQPQLRPQRSWPQRPQPQIFHNKKINSKHK
jgi:hypothetical protein